LLCGYGPLGPFSRRLLAADTHAARSLCRCSRFRSPTIDCAPSVGRDALLKTSRRDSRHEGRGGSAWELPAPASVRRCVMRALLPREPALPPAPSTEPVLFYEPELPLEAHLSMLATLTLRALLPLGEPSPRIHRPLTSRCRLRAPSKRHHPSRARRAHPCGLARLTPPILRPTTRPTDACAPARSPDPAAFRLRCRRRPTGQSRSFATPVKG